MKTPTVTRRRRRRRGARPELRRRLLLTHPRCDRCGCPLQSVDHRELDYAHVIDGRRLVCGRCVPATRRTVTQAISPATLTTEGRVYP